MLPFLRRFLPTQPISHKPLPRGGRSPFRPRLETLDDRITPTVTFTSPGSFGAGVPRGVAVGDFNGDGWADVVATNENAGTVSVLLNGSIDDPNDPLNGIPAFDPAVSFTVGDTPTAVAVGDFNGDGRDDIAVINQQANTVSVLRNITPNLSLIPDGDPSIPMFAEKVDLPLGVGTFASDIVVGDFNGDGRMDLAVSFVNGGGGVAIFKNASAPYAPAVSFAAATLAAVPNLNPQGLTAADLNGDGRTDLAVSLFGNSKVAVVRNTTAVSATPAVPSDPAITFAAAQVFSTGASPAAVRAGDFNGDGLYDLAVVNEGANTVSVLRNATARNATSFAFGAKLDVTVGANPRGLTVGDFNGDGRTDFAVANSGGGTVSVLENTTAAGATPPAFAAAQDSAVVAANPRGLVAADIDRDGRTDLAIADFGSGDVTVLENASTSVVSFGSTSFAVGSGPVEVTVADLDGDGRPDLVTANYDANTVSVRRNTSTGPGVTTFAAAQTFNVGNRPTSVAVGDFDGDGLPDLVVTNYGANGTGNTVSVLRNTTTSGGITFAAQQTFAAGFGPEAVAVGDFDNDGKLDLAVANYNINGVSVLRNISTGTGNIAFVVTLQVGVGVRPTSVAVGDFNFDGRADLAVANFGVNGTGNTVSVLRNTTTSGGIAFASQPPVPVAAGPTSVAVGDFNGDGRPDLAVANYGVNGAGTTVSVLRNVTPVSGTITFAGQQTISVGRGPESVTVGDFDNDGKPDLAVANFGGTGVGGSVSVLRNTSTAPIIAFAAARTFAVAAGPTSVAVGDFDADGLPDLAVANYGTAVAGNTVTVMRNVPSVPVTGPALVVSRGADGVWVYDRLADNWRQLLATPSTKVAAAANGNAIAVFPGYGTFYYRASTGTWTRLHTIAANAVAIDRLGNAYANFSGTVQSSGTYRLAPTALALGVNAVYGWVKLGNTGASATHLAVAGNGDVVANFSSFGVYRFRPTYSDFVRLNLVEAAALAVGDNGQIVVTFAAQATGVYQWRDGPAPGWAYLGMGYNATNLAVDGNGNVAATFNSPTLTNGVQVARSFASANNTTITWDTIHQGTVGSSIAMDLFGNAYFQLTGFGVYEYSVYPGYTKRASFAVTGIGVSR